MELRLRVTRKRVALLIGVIGLVSVGVAYATIPDGNGVFTACRLNSIGTIRLIDPSATPASSLLNHCTSFETQITWNAGGQAGPKGPVGDKGAVGDKGPIGDKGAVGDKGAAGDQGQPGDKGAVGDKGPIGDKGPTGDPGPVGAGFVRPERVYGTDFTVPAHGMSGGDAACPTGKVVVSGSFAAEGLPDVSALRSYRPDNGGESWHVDVFNHTNNPEAIVPIVYCE